MRVPQLMSDFLDWRWAPCVGLTAGSLAFVALALVCIPTQFDGAPATGAAQSFARANGTPQRALFGAALTRESTMARPPAREESSPERSPEPPPAQNAPTGPQQRGFSPIAEREAPPPQPMPEPPPLQPDANGVILQQPDGPGGPSREVTNP